MLYFHERTALACREIANSVTSMLSFTSDYPSKHVSGEIPVLDLALRVNSAGKVNYVFFRKDISNPVSIPAISALSDSVKYSSYRMEVFRILRNTNLEAPWCVKAELLSDLNLRMKISGYDTKFRMKIMNGGIRGYLKTLSKSQAQNKPFNRNKAEIRLKMKNNSKDDWFKKDPNTKAPLFVPSSVGSELTKIIKKIEDRNSQGRSSRIKVVEKPGVELSRIVSNKFPWEKTQCDDLRCLVCPTNDGKISCRTPNVGYSVECLTCKENGLTVKYIGESSKPLFDRSQGHSNEFKSKVRTNALVIHNEVYHNSSKEMNFEFKPVRTFRTALDRQLDESLRIQSAAKQGILMNSGCEFKKDKVPRARFAPKPQTFTNSHHPTSTGTKKKVTVTFPTEHQEINDRRKKKSTKKNL